MHLAVWVNISLSVLIEILFIYFTTIAISKPSTPFKLNDNDQIDLTGKKLIVSETGQLQIIEAKNTQPIAFQLCENVLTSSSKKEPEKFERSNKFLEPSANEMFEPIPKQVLTELKYEFKKTGKSDATILYLWDNGYTNKSQIGRIAGRVLKGNRKTISPSYVCRVIKRERGK